MDIRVKLAKNVTELYVRSHREAEMPLNLPYDLGRQRACYVYIYQKPGVHLKAIYGYPLPQSRNLAAEITRNTITAIGGQSCLLIKKADLSSLMYSVAVLDTLHRINDVYHLQPDRYGLYVNNQKGKWAVVMPQRPGIETSQEQLATALREATISNREDNYTMYRFGVIYYE